MNNLTKMSIEIHKNTKPETYIEFLHALIERLREENEGLQEENTRLKNDTLFGC